MGPLPSQLETVATLSVRGAEDAELEQNLTKHGIALSVAEARRIAAELGRDPALVEAHAFDAQWSEHCSYKSSRVHLARLPTESPDVILGPGEDAGIVRLGEWNGESYGIVVAHESHNHPSQVVPFEGAATGIGGIVRDVLCMGARVIALADPLRFGPLDDPHSRYVAQGVVDGIAAYGNAIGVPTIAGDVYFHEGFRDNCLVNVVALGIVKESEIIHSRAPAGSEGWDIVLVGKATDRSGFGGAAFSSLVLDEKDAEANKSAVQVPDPFLKNVIMRASYRAFDVIRELGLTVGFKDLGAGGIMGCTAELAASGGFGARIALERCPTSQPNLPPAVIAVGETQERLAWVVPPSFTPRLLQIYNEEFSLPEIARHAQAAVIGTITTEKDYVLTHHGTEVMNVPIEFLTAGIKYERPYTAPPVAEPIDAPGANRWLLPDVTIDPKLFEQTTKAVLGHTDVASRRTIFERYDSVVRGVTSIPCGFADSGVVVPIPGAPLAFAVSVDGNARYASIDPRWAAELAVVESVANVVSVGARPAAMTDCLNFGNPEDPAQLAELVAAIDGLTLAARELRLPFVSGNVSLYNQSAAGKSIPGSAIVACIGVIEDVSASVTSGFKRVGSSVVFLRYAVSEPAIGGSVIGDVLGFSDRRLPSIDCEKIAMINAAVLDSIHSGLVLAIHDVSDGGVMSAVAEMIFASRSFGTIGFEFEPHNRWTDGPEGATEAYFSESGGFVVEATDDEALRTKCSQHGLASMCEFFWLGRTTGSPHILAEKAILSVSELYKAWSQPLGSFYEGVLA